ncbi:hypothetical protein ALP29_201062 [Pseudomonas syringae pv. avii]|uniref:Uncharacterized protein n=1 Tax=Pseudomonas syringae pv. avii TaxID=663959 RepID=A0A3M5VV74_PSESX|nr:hypothetical protein ALP29_201062 [Pseudomonas syringae pv. avii]
MLVDQGIERIILPVLHLSGRHHIGVTGETQYRPFAGAVSGPEIIDVFDAHRLKLEAGIAQALHHHRLAIGIDRRDRWSADQVAGKLEGRREVGGGRHVQNSGSKTLGAKRRIS